MAAAAVVDVVGVFFAYDSHTFWIKDGNQSSSNDLNKFKAFLQLNEFSTIIFLVFYTQRTRRRRHYFNGITIKII